MSRETAPDPPTPAEQKLERYNRTLQRLARRPLALGDDLAGVLRGLARDTAEALSVSRVSVWRYTPDRRAISCAILYEAAGDAYSEGVVLSNNDYPAYFEAMARDEVIVADDARADPRTKEFVDGYLVPLDIHSMLDAPLWLRGDLIGVLCCEQTGAPRRWLAEEQTFVLSVAALASLALETHQRAAAERELRAAHEAAAAAGRAKNLFLANISHELRTPMNAIIGLTELLQASKPGGKEGEYLSLILHSARSLHDIIQDLLDLSTADAGRLRLRPGPMELREQVGMTLKTLAPRAFEKGLELTLEVDPDLPDHVVGDRIRLGQILFNLVGNAIKFTARGEVHVEIDLHRLAADYAEVVLRVRDTGIGIAEDKLRAVFEPFEQVDTSSTRRYGGAGLGLTITNLLVGMMGGRIDVRSAPGAGTTFEAYVRLALPPPGLAPPPSPPSPRLAGAVVLVIDDSLHTRTVIRRKLERARAVCLSAGTAAEAMGVLETARDEGRLPQVVLLDESLPGAGVPALVRDLRRHCPENATRVVLTSVGGPIDAEARRQAGIGDVLLKPVTAPDLYLLLDRLLASLEVAPRPAAKLPRRFSRAYRVLIAEDNHLNQMIARNIVQSAGGTCAVVENGRLALEVLDRETFDVVLMDWQMPVMDGLDAVRTIRKREALTADKIPIVMVTAHCTPEDRQACLRAGCDDFIGKPIDIDLLIGTIDRLAASPRPVGPDAPPIDVDAIRRRVGDGFFRELVRLFLQVSPEMIADLNAALAAGDASRLRVALQRLRTTLATFGPKAILEIADRLDGHVRAGDRAALPAAHARLIDRVERLVVFFRDLLGRLDDPPVVGRPH